MAGAASAAMAFSGLCVGISVAVVLPFLLLQSLPGVVDADQAAEQLDPSAHEHIMIAGAASFFTATTMIYAHLHNGGGAGDRRVREVMFLSLCASVGILCMQPGPVVQAPAPVLLGVAAVQLLPYAGAATFYLALMLTYVRVGAAAAGAGNERYRAAEELLNTVTLGVTLFTGVLGSIVTAALVFNTK